MKPIQSIKLFISCPSDIKQELDSIKIIVDEINKTTGQQSDYLLQLLNWAEDTYTQIGEDAQDVINQQFDSQYDILVGILWQKIGSPTKRDKSGTIEEINRAIGNNGKELLVYFNIIAPENLNDVDLVQLVEVRAFKKQLADGGLLYKEYDSIAKFESLFRINIIKLISDMLKKTAVVVVAEGNGDKANKYEVITTAIKNVEVREVLNSLDVDVFELVEGLLSSFSAITNSLNSMTVTTNDIAGKMNLKTQELNKLVNIKDDRLRMEKSKILVNILADELLDFTRRMEAEKDILIEHYLQTGPRYLQIMQFEQAYQVQSEVDLRKELLNYRNSAEEMTKQSASFLETISQWPPVTSKFNNSKRQTELILKDITKIFLDGLILLDAALENTNE